MSYCIVQNWKFSVGEIHRSPASTKNAKTCWQITPNLPFSTRLFACGPQNAMNLSGTIQQQSPFSTFYKVTTTKLNIFNLQKMQKKILLSPLLNMSSVMGWISRRSCKLHFYDKQDYGCAVSILLRWYTGPKVCIYWQKFSDEKKIFWKPKIYGEGNPLPSSLGTAANLHGHRQSNIRN